jgi:hypothetical protein
MTRMRLAACSCLILSGFPGFSALRGQRFPTEANLYRQRTSGAEPLQITGLFGVGEAISQAGRHTE